MSQVIHGVIHGRTIELSEDLGLADGQPVTVIVQPSSTSIPGNGERVSAAGMLADYPEMDEYLEDVMRSRKLVSRREIDE